MGKFKVSFTTALFAFSFLVCVIVAVVFVDRSPKNDYDSFYDQPAGQAVGSKSNAPGNSGWDPSAATPTPVTAPPAPPPVSVEAILADLPVATQPGVQPQGAAPATVTMTPVNPMVGRTPEEIARALMGRAGIEAAAQAATVPGMAVPAGIATPASAAAAAAPPPPAASSRSYLPMQSNTQGSAPGMLPSASSGYRGPLAKTGGPANPSSGLTNAAALNPITGKATPANLIGIHKMQGGTQPGMMIGSGRVESGAQPPAGFTDAPQADGTMPIPSLQGSPAPSMQANPAAASPPGNPASALPGSADKPLLFPPQSDAGSNKWELPPAPTLKPPMVQDPDQRRSEADQTPGSLNPDETSDQAFVISAVPDGTTSSSGDAISADVAAALAAVPTRPGEPVAPADPDADTAAQVNDIVLKKDAALRLARVAFKLKDKKLTKDEEDKEAEKAAEQWKEITAAAQQAKLDKLTVGAPDVEHYAALRPDFEPAVWQMAMEEEGFSAAEIRDQLGDIALSEKLIETQFEDKVKDTEIQEAYDKSPSKFAAPRRFRLQEIFKKKPADKDRAERVEREIRRLQKQAAGGTDFALLARQASDAPTAKRGGNLGWIDPTKDKDAARDKALDGIHEGDVTEVLDEDDGFRIYRLADEKPAAKDFDGAKEQVIAELKKPMRETAFADALKKLDAGELKPATPEPESATAIAAKQGTPVVPTRVGSSMMSSDAEAKMQQALAKIAAKTAPPGQESAAKQESTADSTVAAKSAESSDKAAGAANPPSDEEARRKFVAQELLGEAAAKRRAEERGEPYISPKDMPQQQASTEIHQPGEQASLLYAPGSQVQQMAGGQPASPQQPGGMMMAPQVQDNLQAPNSAVVNYGENQALPANSAAGQNPYQRPATTKSESNGWNVVKTRMEHPVAQLSADQGNAPEQSAQAQAQPNAGAVPPGFEGTDVQGPQQPHKKSGIVGNVKSFFGSFGH